MLLSISFHLLVFNYIWKKKPQREPNHFSCCFLIPDILWRTSPTFFSYQLHTKISRTSNSTAVRRIEKHYVVIACRTSEGQGNTSTAWDWQTRRNGLPTPAGQHGATQRTQSSFPKPRSWRERVRCGIQISNNQSQTWWHGAGRECPQ